MNSKFGASFVWAYDLGHKFAQYVCRILLNIKSVKNSFLKKVIAIVVFTSLFSHSLCRIGITAWYELNRSSITTQHCENKDKPQVGCNGKCYLKKQLKKLDQNSEAPARPGNTKACVEDYPVFVVPDYIVHNFSSAAMVVVYFGKAPSGYGFLHERLVYNPPKPMMGSACA